MPADENTRAINDVLVGLPLTDRLAALACSIIVDDPRALHAVCSLISFAGIMARQLQPASAWRLHGTCSRRSSG